MFSSGNVRLVRGFVRVGDESNVHICIIYVSNLYGRLHLGSSGIDAVPVMNWAM
jgi:hypothetical protein